MQCCNPTNGEEKNCVQSHCFVFQSDFTGSAIPALRTQPQVLVTIELSCLATLIVPGYKRAGSTHFSLSASEVVTQFQLVSVSSNIPGISDDPPQHPPPSACGGHWPMDEEDKQGWKIAEKDTIDLCLLEAAAAALQVYVVKVQPLKNL